jgi:hypothetical protein
MRGLGLRLVFGTDRSGRIRLVMMVGGVAAAVALLLGVTGALPAAAQRIGKTVGRGVAVTEGNAGRAEGVRARLSVGFWRGHEIRVLLVEVTGPPVAPPIGVPRTPQPGEVFVSPALVDALAGKHAAEVAPRVPGTVVGTVTQAGLVGPDELYAVAGVAPGTLHGYDMEGHAAGFARPPKGMFFASSAYIDGTGFRQASGPVDEALIALGLAMVGFIAPLVVLVGTSTRLSAASRERRASAMRLIGATARQMRTLGAVEGAVVGVLGTAAGAALFLLLRAPAAGAIPVESGLYANEVAPPWPAWPLLLAGIPALTALTGTLALRKAVSSPLGVRRRAASPGTGGWRLVPLGIGLAMVACAHADRSAVITGAWHGRGLLLGGAMLCLVGIAVGGASVSRLAGRLLARWGPGMASQLAGRRLVADPAGAARAITGAALVVVVAGWVIAFLPVLTPSGMIGTDELVAEMRPQTVVVSLNRDAPVDQTAADLRSVAGVGAVVPIRRVNMLPEGAPDTDTVSVLVADCADLAQVFRAPTPDCRPGTVQRLNTGAATATGRLRPVSPTGEPLPPGPAVPVPPEPTDLTLPTLDGELLALGADLLVPPKLLPRDAPDVWFPTVLVATDGRASTQEALRARLGARQTPYPPVTPQELLALDRSATGGYGRAALIGVLAVVLAGGLSLAVTTADALRERRRAHAALTAMGVPVRTLRRGVLLQTALPLVLNIGLAMLVTAATSWLYLRVAAPRGTVPPPLPLTGYAAISAAALAACLLATAAALPFVRAATRPDALRTE